MHYYFIEVHKTFEKIQGHHVLTKENVTGS